MFPLRTKYFLLCLLLLAVALPLSAQPDKSSAELRQERQALQRKLAATTRALATTKKNRGASVRRASLLQEQVEQRTALVATLREEISRGAVHLRRDSSVIEALNQDLDRMRAEYAGHLRALNRSRYNQGWMVFLLSAASWNDLLRRNVYLRQYRAYRMRQSQMIRRTRLALEARYATLANQRTVQDSLLTAAMAEDSTLRVALVEEQRTLSELTASERRLVAQAKRQRAKDQALEKEIRSIIRRVIARDKAAAREREKRTRSGARGTTIRPAPPRPRRGASIARQRGHLAWPSEGRVVQKFGTHPHPKMPRLKTKSNGIDIDAGPSAAVAAVYTGNVMSVRSMPGAGYLVMLRHDTYYTVYTNLAHALVKAGDEVVAGQQLGLTDAAGTPLHFELWRGKQALNPEAWLR